MNMWRPSNARTLLDYDDLLLYWAEMMKVEDIAGEIGDRFDHVLVDEYQDTNRLQSKILLRLKPDGRGVMVVGDDAQASIHFALPPFATFWTFPTSLSRGLALLRLSKITDLPSQYWTPATLSWALPKNGSRKNLRSDRKSKQKPYLTTVADEVAQARYVAHQILQAREAGLSIKIAGHLVSRLIT